MEVRATIAKRLGETIHSICKGSEPANMFEDLMEDFVDAAEFVDYFKATWYPRLGYPYYSRLQFSLCELSACYLLITEKNFQLRYSKDVHSLLYSSVE